MLSRFSFKIEYLALFLIAVLAIMYTVPVGEGDFFFHVRTGKWIWENRSIPVSDPFNFPLQGQALLPGEGEWVRFVLSQYWLGQLILYGVWSLGGEAGMVALRVAAFCGILLFYLQWFSRRGVGVAELLALFLAGNILVHYSAERPQLFAFILLPLLLRALEGLRRSVDNPPPLTMGAVLLIVLAWCNLHGSFILAIFILAMYAADHLYRTYRNGQRVNGRLLTLLAGGVLLTFANPGGWKSFDFSFNFLKIQASRTSEFASPFAMTFQHHVIDYPYWLLAIAVVGMLLWQWRRVEPVHAAVVLGLLLLSFKGTRYIPFFAVAAPLLCRSLPVRRPSPKVAVALALLLSVWAATADYRNVFKFRAEKSFPVGAARFLAEARPSGNLFNYVTWGGYLLCYTGYPVFVDTRNLVERYVMQHDMVLAGVRWQEILDGNGIQTIIVPGTNAISMQPYPLLFQLLSAPEWSLVYRDDVALVLVRNSARNRGLIERYAMDKNGMAEHISARIRWQTAGTL